MVSIYCIEDINDLKYIGSTSQNINTRYSQHKYHKKIGHHCSSNKLNLYNCIVYELEKCSEEDRYERERHWASKIECVNETYYLNQKEFYEDKAEKSRQQAKRYYAKNKEKCREKHKQYYDNNKKYFKEYNEKYRQDPDTKWKLLQYGKEWREKQRNTITV